MPNPLGICTHQPVGAEYPCGGDLCVSSQGLDARGNPIPDGETAVKVRRVVRCEECGNIMADHEATKGESAPQPPAPKATDIVKIGQFASSERDRIGKLERTVAEQGKRLDTLVAALTAKPSRGMRAPQEV